MFWLDSKLLRVPLSKKQARKWLMLAAFLTCLILALGAGADPVSARSEAEIKAAYLFNFTKFVSWETPLPVDKPLTLCILGHDPFSGLLEPLSGKTTQGKILEIKNIRGPEKIPGCQVLFVSQSERRTFETAWVSTDSHHVLTVSDIPDFAYEGGIIGLQTQGNVIRFTINLHQAKLAGLSFNSRLLELASKVIQ